MTEEQVKRDELVKQLEEVRRVIESQNVDRLLRAALDAHTISRAITYITTAREGVLEEVIEYVSDLAAAHARAQLVRYQAGDDRHGQISLALCICCEDIARHFRALKAKPEKCEHDWKPQSFGDRYCPKCNTMKLEEDEPEATPQPTQDNTVIDAAFVAEHRSRMQLGAATVTLPAAMWSAVLDRLEAVITPQPTQEASSLVEETWSQWFARKSRHKEVGLVDICNRLDRLSRITVTEG